MYLLKVPDDGDVRVYAVADLEVDPSWSGERQAPARERQPRAWRYQPKLGAECGGGPSRMASPGYAAYGHTVRHAARLIEELRAEEVGQEVA